MMHRTGWISSFVLLACVWACGDSIAVSHSDLPDALGTNVEDDPADDAIGSGLPSTTSDNWAKSADSPVPLLAIWGSGTNDVWAVGSKNTVLHWNGTTWTPTLSGTSGNLRGVWGSGSSDVWAVGGSGDSYGYGQILRWNGATWTVSVSQSSCEFYGVWGTSSSDVWAVGNADAMTESCIYRWDGTAWKEHTGFATGPLKGIWGSGANDVWAVGGNISDNGVISHWDGSAWTVVAQGSELLALYGLTAVWGNSSSDVWAIGSQNVAHWNGQAWTIEQCTGYAFSLAAGSTQPKCQEGNFAVWGSAANDVWVAGAIVTSGFVRHWNGTSWTLTDNDMDGAIYGIWGTGPKDVWTVGSGQWDAGVILHHKD